MLTIVMGPSNAGKSTYIKNNLNDLIVFDLYNYQKPIMSLEEIFDSYKTCSRELCKALKEDPSQNYVLEHTLLKRIRRKWYLEDIRKVYDGPIEIICLKPSLDTLKRNSTSRFGTPDREFILKNNLDVLELPTIDEGFDKITIIEC